MADIVQRVHVQPPFERNAAAAAMHAMLAWYAGAPISLPPLTALGARRSRMRLPRLVLAVMSLVAGAAALRSSDPICGTLISFLLTTMAANAWRRAAQR